MTNLEDFAEHFDPTFSTTSLAADDARRSPLGVNKSAAFMPDRNHSEAGSGADSRVRPESSDKIGLMINSSIAFISDYLADAMTGIASAAETHGLNVTLYTGMIAKPGIIHQVSRAREIGGAILFWSAGIDPAVEILLQEHIPFVVLGRRINHPAVSYFAPDNIGGTYSAIRHLIALGHRRIGFMTRAELGTTNTDRLAGFSTAMSDSGVPIDETLIVPTHIEPDSGYHAMHLLLDRPDPPTAVFAFEDSVALDAMRAAVDRGSRIPEDVAIVGFGGLRSAMTTIPSITTLAMPLKEVGAQAVELLIRLIHAPDSPPERQTVPVNLIIRASTIGEA